MNYPTVDMREFRKKVYQFVKTLTKLGLTETNEIVKIHQDIRRTGADGPKRAKKTPARR
jgi:hypothetical protein